MAGHARAEPKSPDMMGFELEAALIRVLANPKRLMIVNVLGRRPATVTELADRLSLSLQNTSQHLRVMRDRNIVRAHRDGREVHYELTSSVFSQCCQLVRRSLLEEARNLPTHLGWGEGSVARSGDGRVTGTRPARAATAVAG